MALLKSKSSKLHSTSYSGPDCNFCRSHAEVSGDEIQAIFRNCALRYCCIMLQENFNIKLTCVVVCDAPLNRQINDMQGRLTEDT